MKGRYTLYLDKEPVEVVRPYLEKLGFSMSGYVSMIFSEFAKAIQGQPSTIREKKFEDLTLKEFSDYAAYWFGKVKEAELEEG